MSRNGGAEKIRLLVLTDISSNRGDFKEPDDTQSLVRLLLYANHFDIEGLIATYTKHWHDSKPEYIAEVVRAYGKVRDRLAAHDERFPTESQLSRAIKRGNPQDGLAHVGAGHDTEASDWIIARTDAEDERPLWVTVWGGTTDLAQALWKVRATRSAEATARFVAKLRVYSIGDQYGIGSWIRDQFPGLFCMVPRFLYRGMYKGGARHLTTPEWVETHIRREHGPLGEAYPNYDGGDLWDRVEGLKEGDSPSFLYLIPNGLGDPEHPEYGSWGGRFVRSADNARHFVDARDEAEDGEGAGAGSEDRDFGGQALGGRGGKRDDRGAEPGDGHRDSGDSGGGARDGGAAEPGEWLTVSRWREAYQASFAARMDWCVLPPGQAGREPLAVVAGAPFRRVAAGETVELDARASSHPNGGGLAFRWFVYREAGTYAGPVRLEGGASPQARLHLPPCGLTGTVHVILELTERRTPAMTSYRRVVIEVGSETAAMPSDR